MEAHPLYHRRKLGDERLSLGGGHIHLPVTCDYCSSHFLFLSFGVRGASRPKSTRAQSADKTPSNAMYCLHIINRAPRTERLGFFHFPRHGSGDISQIILDCGILRADCRSSDRRRSYLRRACRKTAICTKITCREGKIRRADPYPQGTRGMRRHPWKCG